ncbi:unnamed protein product [Cylicocyclus nassatus]|uniref:Uncharacterized protein n=1 Tax=Cylicocyclus nassatus TaxID=53992 RepID=A0AA36H1T5_CYLNA|nr:unnamed protein product [Cylicocyclus nassatus]
MRTCLQPSLGLRCDCTVPEIKEWKSIRDAHNRDRLRPQLGSAARPIAGMRRTLSFLNTSHVSGPRVTNMADDDDYDFLDEIDPFIFFTGAKKGRAMDLEEVTGNFKEVRRHSRGE